MKRPLAEGKLLIGMSPTRLACLSISQMSYALGRRLVHSRTRDILRPAVVIGAITLRAKAPYSAAVQQGFSAAGVDTVLCGQLPIPAVAYLTRASKHQAFVVVDSAWNSDWNGHVGFFSPQGLYLNNATPLQSDPMKSHNARAHSCHEVGQNSQFFRPGASYIEFCKSGAMQQLNLNGLKIVVDSAHGSAQEIAPKLLHELGAQVIAIGLTTHGLNDSECAGASISQQLTWTVRTLRADVGISINREGNLLMMADSTGLVHCGNWLRSATPAENTSGASDDAIIGALHVLSSMQATKLSLRQLMTKQPDVISGLATDDAHRREMGNFAS